MSPFGVFCDATRVETRAEILSRQLHGFSATFYKGICLFFYNEEQTRAEVKFVRSSKLGSVCSETKRLPRLRLSSPAI